VRLRLGPGPVFAYEWLMSTRRWQLYALRAGFIGSILVGMIFIGHNDPSRVRSGQPVSIQQAAQYGEAFYGGVVVIELTLVLLAGPAATAGAICLDKGRGTLDHLLATDLSNAEIVLGKLGVRLISVLGLIACVVPITALAGLLGGIIPEALIGSFLTAIACAVLSCSLAMTLSVWGRKTHEVLMLTYLIVLLWISVPKAVEIVVFALGFPPPARGALPMLETIWDCAQLSNPYILVFLPYANPGRIGLSTYFGFLGVCLFLSVMLLAVAARRIRVVAMKQTGRPAEQPRSRRARSGLSVSRPTWLPQLPRPSLDGNPILWREWHRARPSWMSFVAWSLYAALGILLTIVTLTMVTTSSGNLGSIGFLNAAQVTVGLLLLSTTAVTSLAEERARGSLDVLLCTPLSTRTILVGKWWGAFRQTRPILIWPAAAAGLLAVPTGRWLAYLAFLGLMLAYSAVIASLGLAVATWVSRLRRAIALCVGLYVVSSIGWAVLTVLTFSPDPIGRYVLMGTPSYGTLLATCAVGPEPMAIPGDRTALQVATVFWSVLHFGLAATLYAVTLTTFDQCLGRNTRRPREGVSRLDSSAILEELSTDFYT
jgi:ABC-type transport system involved in multi-copper enzyme maturation permease subunit